MNLNFNPTPDQLRELIRERNDSAGDHVLWVKGTGDVEIVRTPAGQTPLQFQQAHPDMRFRYETFLVGNDYVGPEAADDDEWIGVLFGSLVEEWSRAREKPRLVHLNSLSWAEK